MQAKPPLLSMRSRNSSESKLFVPDEDHGLGQKRQKIFGSGGCGALTGEKEEGHDLSSFINGHGELRVVPAFGESHRVILRASDRFLASLVDLDEGAVDRTEVVFWLSSQTSKKFCPERPTSTQRRQQW
jgi:hypothetical protein